MKCFDVSSYAQTTLKSHLPPKRKIVVPNLFHKMPNLKLMQPKHHLTIPHSSTPLPDSLPLPPAPPLPMPESPSSGLRLTLTGAAPLLRDALNHASGLEEEMESTMREVRQMKAIAHAEEEEEEEEARLKIETDKNATNPKPKKTTRKKNSTPRSSRKPPPPPPPPITPPVLSKSSLPPTHLAFFSPAHQKFYYENVSTGAVVWDVDTSGEAIVVVDGERYLGEAVEGEGGEIERRIARDGVGVGAGSKVEEYLDIVRNHIEPEPEPEPEKEEEELQVEAEEEYPSYSAARNAFRTASLDQNEIAKNDSESESENDDSIIPSAKHFSSVVSPPSPSPSPSPSPPPSPSPSPTPTPAPSTPLATLKVTTTAEISASIPSPNNVPPQQMIYER